MMPRLPRSIRMTPLSRRWSELVLLTIWSLCFFMLCALMSHDPTDVSFLYYTTTPHETYNWCGRLGAQLAALFMYLFGASSLLVVALVALLATVWFYQGWRVWADRIAGMVCALLATSSLCAAYGVDWLASTVPGGMIGSAIIDFLTIYVGPVGALIVLYTTLGVSLILLFNCSLVAMIHILLHRATARAVKRVARRLYGTLRLCVAQAHYLFRLLVNKVLNTAWGESLRSALLSFWPQPSTEPLEAEIDDFWQQYQSGSPLQPQATDGHEESPTYNEPLIEQNDPRDAQPALVYQLPELQVVRPTGHEEMDKALAQEGEVNARILQEKLERFGVFGTVVSIKRGPVVTLYEYQPHIDTKLSKIIALEDDLALALQALSIRIIAPIPGTNVVGFEVANKHRKPVLLSPLLQHQAYRTTTAQLPLIIGQDTMGNALVRDLAVMPHLLLAGSTGSGKSVVLHSFLMSLLCKKSPQELRLLLIDPKRLEFAAYADIAHLLVPIVTDAKGAVASLRWVVNHMHERYELMAKAGARDIIHYHQRVRNAVPLPYLVIVIDELSDLMISAGRDIEEALIRIAQMARAAGIHIIAATQRPSVDVLTGLIKVNFPSRISLRVSSKIDSRTILDSTGAEKLLGRGDMLLLDADSQLRRVHGAYVCEGEVAQVTEHIKQAQPTNYIELNPMIMAAQYDEQEDLELYNQVLEYLAQVEEISISLLQRKFRIGYNRSARMIDLLEARGHIGPSTAGRTRKVLRT